jgi:hypothetical protein
MTVLPLIDTAQRVEVPLLTLCDGFSDEERADWMHRGVLPEGVPDDCARVVMRPLSSADMLAAEAEAGPVDMYAGRLSAALDEARVSGDYDAALKALTLDDRARLDAASQRVMRYARAQVARAVTDWRGLDLDRVPHGLYGDLLGELLYHVSRLSRLGPEGKARRGQRSPGLATGA